MASEAMSRPTVEELKKALRDARRRRRRSRLFRGLLIVLVLALAAGVVLADRCFTLVTVHGNSMRKTLENGSVILCQRRGAFGEEEEVARGDLILFDYEDSSLIKRVIGRPGDRVFIRNDGTVLINGVQQQEDYVSVPGVEFGDLTYPVTVPEGCYFVMGDHRNTSIDSRISAFGMVSEADITGKPLYVVWPTFRIGKIGD